MGQLTGWSNRERTRWWCQDLGMFRGDFTAYFWVLTVTRPHWGPYLSSCCKLWSMEGQQYWWRVPKLWTVRLVGNKAAKAALLPAVGVVGAEKGCPETDGGRTLTGRNIDGRQTHTQQSGWSRETRAVSAEADSETHRESIWSCTFTDNHKSLNESDEK